ncbi:MAG: hypothetical protein AAF217_09610, partial [Pseudomonadota bacterium]
NQEPSEIQACMQKYDRLVFRGELCEKGTYTIDKYKVRDIEFNELDFYWSLGDTFMRSFREEYLMRRCKQSRGFWAKTLGWNCADSVEEFLAKL